MNEPTSDIGTMLRVSRTYSCPRQRVFDAWTRPENLQNWWGVGNGFTTTIVEVDLRVGGAYRLGMKPPDGEHVHTATGVFEEVDPPGRLVYTWAWEASSEAPIAAEEFTRVTVEFIERGSQTELVLTHELFPDEGARNQHNEGWTAILGQLEAFVSEN